MANLKNDSEKLKHHLLPEECIEDVVRILQGGAKKYGDFNWMESPGFEYTRLYNSLRRHLGKWRKGQDRDEESQELEIAHVACNALMLLYYQKMQLGIDDREQYKNPKAKG
jgi:hypothetical protein